MTPFNVPGGLLQTFSLIDCNVFVESTCLKNVKLALTKNKSVELLVLHTPMITSVSFALSDKLRDLRVGMGRGLEGCCKSIKFLIRHFLVLSRRNKQNFCK